MTDATGPLICEAGNSYKNRVRPQQRCNPPGDEQQRVAASKTIYAAKDELGQGLVTIDLNLRVQVRELIYPGDSSVAIAGKWIYVLRDSTFQVEAYAVSENEWQSIHKPNPGTPNAKRTLDSSSAARVVLDPGPRGSPYKYHFFLSPIRLAPKALRHLQDKVAEASIHRQFRCQAEAIVEVPDPFHWAADAHNKYYIPRLDALEQFTLDAEGQAKLFMAGVLDALLKDNATGVRSRLKDGEPDAWVKKYRQDEQRLRTEAEEAAAYTSHCIDCDEHFIVEMAGMETGGEDLGICYANWAVISERMTNVIPGRQFVANVVANKERLPAKFLFVSHSPPTQLNFEDYRYSWLCALETFENLVPEKFRELSIQKIPPLTHVKEYLKSLDLKTREVKLVGKQKTIAKNLEAGRSLSKGFGTSAGSQKTFRDRYNGLVIDATAAAMERAEKQAGALPRRLDKFHLEYEGTMFGLKMTLGTVIELVNVSNAITEYLQALGDEKGLHLTGSSKARNIAGAIADVSGHVIELTQELLKKELGEVALRRFAGAGGLLAVVSGACDMLTFEEGLVKEGLAKNDFAVAAGKAISASGSVGIAVVGALTLASAISPELAPTFVAGGGAGLLAGVICGILIVGGCLISAWLRGNYYQQFAGACCFGKSHGEETWFFDWAPSGMGMGSAVNESTNLIHLLAAFQVRGGSYGITIHPGYITDDCIFEIKARNRWYGIEKGRRRLIYDVLVRLDTDDIRQLSGPFELPASSIHRNEDGAVSYISVSTDEKYTGEYKGSWMEMSAWVRMKSRIGQLSQPARGSWIKIDALYDGSMHSSLDSSLMVSDEDPTVEKEG